MKKALLSAGAALLTLTCITAALHSGEKKSDGGHPASTGAPGERTCAQAGCHTNAKLSDGKDVNEFIFGAHQNSFEPGRTYDVTVRINDPASTKFGFQVVALSKAGQNLGQFVLSDTSTRVLILDDNKPLSRKYLTHTRAGTQPVAPGVGEWTFGWTAPGKGVDSVYFYFVTNATNHDNTNQGDHLYFSRATVGAAVLAGVHDKDYEQAALVHYDPIARAVSLEYILEQAADLKISVIDYTGRIILQSEAGNRSEGPHSEMISFGRELTAGAYFLVAEAGRSSFTRKFIAGR